MHAGFAISGAACRKAEGFVLFCFEKKKAEVKNLVVVIVASQLLISNKETNPIWQKVDENRNGNEENQVMREHPLGRDH